MLDINERLNNLENRLMEIELKLGITRQAASQPQTEPAAKSAPVRGPETTSERPWAELESAPRRAETPSLPQHQATKPVPVQSREPFSTTQLMAWAAGFALLLAAIYFLKLVYDVGWLTPERQLLLASVAGFSLIGIGLFFARIDRNYAAYLPALGLIVLYLTVYTAHLYYHLWNSGTAIAATSAITVLGIWLGRRFNQSVYVILAATGVYLSPLLMQAMPDRLFDIVIYYSAWSLLFSFCSLSEGRRVTYVLPMFFALIGFDLIWRTSGQGSWLLAVIYQLIQFTVFAITTAAFSVIHKKPLNNLDGVTHGFALIYFYGLEYIVLKQHVPHWAPVVGILSGLLVFLIYLIARAAFKEDKRAGVGAVIVSAYCSLVAAHALFLEWMPHGWFPWGALIIAVAVGLVFSQYPDKSNPAWKPVLIIAGLIFGGSYLALLAGAHDGVDIVMPNAALAMYAIVLYGGYYLFSRAEGNTRAAPIVLYGAHFAFMECGLQVVGNGLPLSMVWAVFAVAILVIAIWSKDKLLGQSSLLIFCASGLKVLLHDLAGSGSLIRVMTLVVLAISLYVGGWLYQSLVRQIAD
jgi:Predicted membrane protein (DUF2339)